MGYVYIYGPTADDFDTTGLCGALVASECTHEEIAGGMSAVTLVHPFDEMGRWKHIERGCILKCDCRVRTTPEIKDGQIVTAVETWTVKATATVGERGVFSRAVKGSRKTTLKPGTRVIVVRKGAERYKIKSGKTAGWISQEAIDFELTPPPLADDTDSIEAIAPPWIVRPQLFRIQDVDVDTEAGTVTAYAPHISYDLSFNNTRFKCDFPLAANRALNGCQAGCMETHTHLFGIMNSCDFAHEFEAYTDIADVRTSAEWVNISPIEALLDPENGFCARWGAELVRDDYEMYFLRRAGRNRGTRVEYGKNLLGVNYSVSDDGVVTAILPTGVRKNGSLLYLTDYDFALENYVYSPHAGDYPVTRAYVLACEDCTVDKKQITIELARARMREQAQRMFDEDKCDLPNVSLTVDFVQLGDTVEYQQYKNLEPVYLYDEVAVVDPRHGVEVLTDVHRIVWDCLRERVDEVELGNVREGDPRIYSWQIQSLDGGKLTDGSVPGNALEDGAIPPEKLDPDFQAAFEQAWADIEQAKGMIDTANAWLDTLDAQLETVTVAVGDNAGAISALRVDADGVRTAVRDAEGNLAALEITANEIATALTDAEGNISTLQQSSSEFSTTVKNLGNEISSVRQTADSISSAVGSLDGRVASLITQVAEGVAIKLKNPAVASSFEAVIGMSNSPFSSTSMPGLTFRYDGENRGGFYIDANSTMIGSENRLEIMSSAGYVFFGPHETSGSYGMICDLNILPRAGGMCDLGGNGNGMRWKKLYATNASDISSDRRVKKRIAPLDAKDLLERLKPARYRLIADDKKLHFGLIAQDVQGAVAGTDYADAALIGDENPDSLGLCYEELIAVLIEGWQAHDVRITELEARLARLEGGTC